jgi:hypothetical protein
MLISRLRLAVACSLAMSVAHAAFGIEVRHVTVYQEPGRFGGWPANHGMWNWGDELLVGFGAGYYKDNGEAYHAIDHERPEEHLLARSLDGGLTWKLENPAERGELLPQGRALHGTELPRVTLAEWQDCPGGIDFTHPDFAMTLRMTDTGSGPSRFYYSTDRGHHWSSPFRFPTFDQKGVACRTDYLVEDKNTCLVFSTAAKANGKEGRPFCARTSDGGKSWQFVGWMAPEPMGYAIMPSTVRLSGKGLLSAIRYRDANDGKSWLDAYFSPDNGEHWQFRSQPVQSTGEGNPAAMLKLADGRVCITYGMRAKPYGMRAKFSRDEGRSWGPEVVLRNDGGGRDLGYPRSVQRADGKIVTVYYFNHDHKQTRYIAATIWDPATIQE